MNIKELCSKIGKGRINSRCPFTPRQPLTLRSSRYDTLAHVGPTVLLPHSPQKSGEAVKAPEAIIECQFEKIGPKMIDMKLKKLYLRKSITFL